MRGMPRAANDEVRRERRSAHPKLPSSLLVNFREGRRTGASDRQPNTVWTPGLGDFCSIAPSRGVPFLEMTRMRTTGYVVQGRRRNRLGLGVGSMGATRRR